MTGVSTHKPNSVPGSDKSNPNKSPEGPNKAKPEQELEDKTNPDSRTVASTLARAGSIGKDVAAKSGEVLLDTTTHLAQEKAKAVIRMTVTDRIRDISQMFHMLPGGERLLSGIIDKFFYPYYKQANPHTDLQPEQIAQQLMSGHTEFLEDDLVNSFDKFIRDNLGEEDRVKYENGEKKVVLSAFKNMLVSQVQTVKEPGGLKKMALRIGNFIPVVNRLGDTPKSIVGGGIGAFVAYKVLHGLWKLVKWGALAIGGYTGVKMLGNKLSGGGAPPPPVALEPEEADIAGADDGAAQPKGKMGNILEGVGKMAQMAAGGAPGMMGMGGGPGGGLGGLVSMLAGGGR